MRHAGGEGYEDTAGSAAPGESATGVLDEPQPQPQESGSLRQLPVAITGAAGFVGTHLCRELTRTGWKVRAIAHNPAKAAERLGDLPLEVRVGDIRDPAAMREALNGCGSLVHLAAIAVEKRGQSYAETNTAATAKLIDAARQCGVERVIYMSQNGADSSSPHEFLRSKGIAEDLVRESDRRWTVLRPSVIFGPEDEFVNVLARLIRLTPVIFPLPGGGSARFQPISVGDVSRAVAAALPSGSAAGRTYSIAGPMPLTLRDMTERILVAMHTSRVIVSLPLGVARPIVAVMQRLLPSPPVTTELLDLLDLDNVVPENDITTSFGIDPVPFAPEELLYLRRITISSALESLLRR